MPENIEKRVTDIIVKQLSVNAEHHRLPIERKAEA